MDTQIQEYADDIAVIESNGGHAKALRKEEEIDLKLKIEQSILVRNPFHHDLIGSQKFFESKPIQIPQFLDDRDKCLEAKTEIHFRIREKSKIKEV